MKNYLCIIVILIISVVSVGAQIHSIPEGGPWTLASTWVGGVVPSATDDVVIHGPVTVTVNTLGCHDLSIEAGASVMNTNAVNNTLNVSGTLTNHGYITNNASLNLTLYLAGDLINHGTISNYQFFMNSTALQTIFLADTAPPIATLNFSSTTPAPNLQMLSDLRFLNCQVDFGNRHLITFEGRTVHNITVEGQYLRSAYIDTQGYTTLNLSGGAYLWSIHAQDCIFEGEVGLNFENHYDRVINNGILQCVAGADIWYGNFHIYQLLENHGTIRNHPSGGRLEVQLDGDLCNYGLISNYSFRMESPNVQSIYFDADALPCQVINFVASNTASHIQMLSDLRFLNCQVDFNSRHLRMYQGRAVYSLELDGSSFMRGSFDTMGYSTLKLINDAYLYTINSIGDVILEGTVVVWDCFSFHSIINRGTFRPYGGHHHISVAGNFYNHGSVFNAVSYGYLHLHCGGDFVNDGTISNFQILIQGTVDQNVYIGGTVSPYWFTLVSDIGPAVWSWDGATTTFQGEAININPYWFGVWQAGSSGRLITIGPLMAMPVPENLSIIRVGDEVKLSWNQVAGAVYYLVYASDQPEGAFTLLPDYVIDENLGDGIVEKQISPSEVRKFYRIAAAN